MDKLKIMFVCKHNVFRSRVAEEYMKKISKYNISSAGVIKFSGDMNPEQQEVCSEFDLILPNQSKTLSLENLREQDRIIIVADDVPKEIFENPDYHLNKVEKWNIRDVESSNLDKENIRQIVKEIIKRVEELNRRLNLKK